LAEKTIVIVDDEAIIVLALKQELQRAFGNEYFYESALNAQEAHDLIEETAADGGKIALIITDWLMPGTRGDQFIREVHLQHPEIPFVVITGHADEAAVERLESHARLDGFIRKPWRAEELVETVRGVLDVV